MGNRTMKREGRRSLAFLLALCMVAYGVMTYTPVSVVKATTNLGASYTIAANDVLEVYDETTVVDLTIENGGRLVIMDRWDAGSNSITTHGSLNITGTFTANNDAILELASIAHAPKVNGTAISLKDPTGQNEVTGIGDGGAEFCYLGGQWCLKPQYRVEYDDMGGQAEVKVGNDVLSQWNRYDFNPGTTITFTLNTPAGTAATDAIVEIEVPVDGAPGPEIFSTEAPDNDPGHKITIASNGTFSFTPNSDKAFTVRVVAWSWDTFPANDQTQFILETKSTGDGKINVSGNPVASITKEYDEDNKHVVKNKYVYDRGATPTVTITFSPNAGNELNLAEVKIEGPDSTTPGIDKRYKNNPGPGEEDISSLINNEYVVQNHGFYSEISAVFGEDSGSSNPPQNNNAQKAKTYIESYNAAFYGGTSDEETNIKNYLAAKLQDDGAHTPNGNVFEGLEGFDTAANLSKKITMGTRHDAPTSGLQLPYYDYTVAVAEGVTATGKVYVLNGAQKFCVKVANEYIIMDASSAQTVDGKKTMTLKSDAVPTKQNVTIFGNGAFANDLEAGSENMVAYRITQDHFDRGSVIGEIGVELVIMPQSASPVKITGGANAAAWDVASMPIFDTSANANAPTVAEIYYGNDGTTGREIKFEKGSVIPGETTKNITKVEFDTSKISADVGTITDDTVNNCFKMTLNSNYDVIPVIITYADGTKGYLEIHRVGLDIAKTNGGGGSMNVGHGIGSQVPYDTNQAVNVVATFYYNNPTTPPTEHVSLYVTIVTDSGVTHKVVSTRLNDDFVVVGQKNGAVDSKYADDFLLWSGSNADYGHLVSVSAICYKPGDADSFGGVMVGSGTGVEWKKK